MIPSDKIKEMMQKAKADITQRKVDLNFKSGDDHYSEALEKAKRAADLQARIQQQTRNLNQLPNFKLPTPTANTTTSTSVPK